MFGLFKKKQPAPKRIDERSHDILSRTAALLEMQLILCRSDEKYTELFNGNFVRGYLVGFFDAAIQHSGIPVESDQDFYLLIAAGHAHLFSGNTDKAAGFALESMHCQQNIEFNEAQRQGGEDCFKFLSGEIRNPTGLLSYFHET